MVGAPGSFPGGDESNVTMARLAEHGRKVKACYAAKRRCMECVSAAADAAHDDEGCDNSGGYHHYNHRGRGRRYKG